MQIHSSERKVFSDMSEVGDYLRTQLGHMNGGALTAPVTRFETHYRNCNGPHKDCSDCTDVDYSRGIQLDVDIWTEIDPLNAKSPPIPETAPKPKDYDNLPHLEHSSALD